MRFENEMILQGFLLVWLLRLLLASGAGFLIVGLL